ncbi:four helix bundle protein [Draconibacterium sp. IB214405]|uniref:four helix bundle protein n=1 Tax=Draconibacterium sp. IB214405 TaxID=3097352 RepID=UPI002A134285|nr:four helix bundle protein [Draconibacterium sp. IB214405]MDX8337741.1 four helix bundle protein [Draconibacterium sp. IB214405]
MAHFRFMDLDIWKEAIVLNDELYDLAEILEQAKHYRMAEQLRAASLSVSNNIAEGAGSFSDKDFANFLKFARRSVFETVNITYVAFRRKFITEDELNKKLDDMDKLSRKITNFRKKILSE